MLKMRIENSVSFFNNFDWIIYYRFCHRSTAYSSSIYVQSIYHPHTSCVWWWMRVQLFSYNINHINCLGFFYFFYFFGIRGRLVVFWTLDIIWLFFYQTDSSDDFILVEYLQQNILIIICGHRYLWMKFLFENTNSWHTILQRISFPRSYPDVILNIRCRMWS